MSKSLNTSLILILQHVKSEKYQKGQHVFEAVKHSIYQLVNKYSNNPDGLYMTEKSLNYGTIKLMEFIKTFHTDDSAPEHKQRIGFKTYASNIARLNKLTIFSNNGIELFEKVQDSCYITNELAGIISTYNSGYTHTYKLSKYGSAFHTYAEENLKNFNKTPKIKDILQLETLSAKDLLGYETFKIPYKTYKNIHNLYYRAFVKREISKELTDKLKSISLLMKNVLGYYKGYVYINNRDLGKVKQDREYTVYTCLSKQLRHYIHPHYMEIDIDSSCLSMNLNIFNDIMKQVGGTHIIIKRKKGDKVIKRQFNDIDTKIEFPTLTSYMNNKYGGRSSIQNALRFKDIKEAKQFITSLNFDSNKGNLEFSSTARKVNVIYTKLLMKEIYKLQKFIHCAVFKTQLNFNIMGKPAKEIRENIYKSMKLHIISNPKNYGKGKKLSGKKLSRLYFMLEKEIRTSVMQYLDKSNVKDYLQIHDCLVFSKQYQKNIEKHELEKFIQAKHGYKLTFSSSEDTNILKKD